MRLCVSCAPGGARGACGTHYAQSHLVRIEELLDCVQVVNPRGQQLAVLILEWHEPPAVKDRTTPYKSLRRGQTPQHYRRATLAGNIRNGPCHGPEWRRRGDARGASGSPIVSSSQRSSARGPVTHPLHKPRRQQHERAKRLALRSAEGADRSPERCSGFRGGAVKAPGNGWLAPDVR